MKTQRKVLVVDDDPVVGKSFERVLATKGYAVVKCSSGAEALDKINKEEYDAVFTDIRMPEMDGIEVASRVKASQPWMPVVIVTGFDSTNSRVQAESIGVLDFMQKPLTPEMIERSADRAMQAKETYVEPAIVEQVDTQEAASRAKNIALFLAAPFIGLLYALSLPFVGMWMLMAVAAKSLWKNPKVKLAIKVMAAPFIGLAFAVVAPVVGLVTLTWMGLTAMFDLI